MADRPINLNKARKARARTEAKAQADRNAVVHGLPKAEKERARAEVARTERAEQAKRRDPATPDDPETPSDPATPPGPKTT